MKKIIVLGAGMVGSAMALDLAGQFDVTSADQNREALDRIQQRNRAIRTLNLDVTDTGQLQKVLQPFDLVVCAVPGFLGFQTLKTIIESGKDVVDISFFPENALELDALAKKHRVTAIVDCGVAPGMGNILLGYHDNLMDVDTFTCFVGGLPAVKKWPFNYKAPFSPVDVIEEYTRPARFVENGKMIVRDALSDVELIEFDGIGTLEAFNSDGLRSLIYTMPHIKNMKEKTLRYPGHTEYIRVLKDSGFFDTAPVKIHGKKIRPIDFTSKILFNEWHLDENEEEFTVMRIRISGKQNGKKTEVTYDLLDRYDPESQTSSMARTTGYTATAAANLITEGIFNKKGVFPPELVGKHEGCYPFITAYLEERGVHYRKTEIKQD